MSYCENEGKIRDLEKNYLRYIDTLNDAKLDLAGVADLLMIIEEWKRGNGEETSYFHLIEEVCRRVGSMLSGMSDELSGMLEELKE